MRRLLGAIAAIALPLVLWNVAPPDGLGVEGRVVLVLLGASVAWLAEPAPDFAVVVGLATAWGLLGLAPLERVFGGFATTTWSIALDRWVAGAVGGVQGIGLELAVMALAVAVMASRIVLPSRPAILLLALAFVPAAPALGISGWVAGIVVMLAANVWVLP